MKGHTDAFKEQLKTLGREIRTGIFYNNTLLQEELYSVTPHYKGSLLKSIMKELEIVSSVDIPKNTIIDLQIGLKINNMYQMLEYGQYIIYSSEKQEDTNTYKIIAYDKMLYSMKKYEAIDIEYPTTLKNYLIALANKIGLEVENTEFANQNRQVKSDLYKDLDYTYRDVLDEISEATGSNIVINGNNNLEVRYFTDTEDIIDEEFLKDINVKFGEKYGAINTIVLSRSAESDNIYFPSPLPENPFEIKIKDNQLMNDNDRADYLPELYQKLNGLEFYLNDFTSTGICYYEPCDIFHVKIGENTYKCVMLNDEINITTGLKEIIYTDMPEQTETDYTKADKTDQRLNQTYLIVDKQNQTIDAVVTQTTDPKNPNSVVNKMSRLSIRVGEIEGKISDATDTTITGESTEAVVPLEGINASEPVAITIRPIGTSISYLYPRNNLYPADNLYMPDRILRFTNTTTNEVFDYELPDDLLYYDSETYDEFQLNYAEEICQVTKKCGYNADGTIYALSTPTIKTFTYPHTIILTDGDYTVSIHGYNSAYLFVRLMSKNIYTSQFATRVEVDSSIKQTVQEIDLSVNKKLENYSTTTQMNSAIALTANSITSTVSETYSTKTETTNAKNEAINSANTSTDNKLQNYSTTTQMNSAINQTAESISLEVSKKVGNDEVISKINQSSEAVQIDANKISLVGKQINLTGDNTTITSTNFSVDKNGNMRANNGTFTGGEVILSDDGTSNYEGKLRIVGDTFTNGEYSKGVVIRTKNSSTNTVSPQSIFLIMYDGQPTFEMQGKRNSGYHFRITEGGLGASFENEVNFSVDGTNRTAQLLNITDFFVDGTIHQTSKVEKKKNFEKFENGLDIVKATDIYKYNLKLEQDGTKKHIGFIIGDKYNYSKEITSQNNDGVDTYSMISVAYKAIQEQQEIIESLEARIKELEEGK